MASLLSPIIFSRAFLGQVYMATGLFEDTEKTLLEAIGVQKEEEEPSAVKGYNMATPEKLYLEWGRIEDSAPPILEGWKETKDTWHVSTLPLVRNYYAQLLMHQDYVARDVKEARQQLRTNIKETKRAGFYRSTIASLFFSARADK